jgi:hypothetical protein
LTTTLATDSGARMPGPHARTSPSARGGLHERCVRDVRADAEPLSNAWELPRWIIQARGCSARARRPTASRRAPSPARPQRMGARGVGVHPGCAPGAGHHRGHGRSVPDLRSARCPTRAPPPASCGSSEGPSGLPFSRCSSREFVGHGWANAAARAAALSRVLGEASPCWPSCRPCFCRGGKMKGDAGSEATHPYSQGPPRLEHLLARS